MHTFSKLNHYLPIYVPQKMVVLILLALWKMVVSFNPQMHQQLLSSGIGGRQRPPVLSREGSDERWGGVGTAEALEAHTEMLNKVETHMRSARMATLLAELRLPLCAEHLPPEILSSKVYGPCHQAGGLWKDWTAEVPL